MIKTYWDLKKQKNNNKDDAWCALVAIPGHARVADS